MTRVDAISVSYAESGVCGHDIHEIAVKCVIK